MEANLNSDNPIQNVLAFQFKRIMSRGKVSNIYSGVGLIFSFLLVAINIYLHRMQ